jgi:hypothetical protein
LKNALYDQRVKIPNHDRLYDELVSLEWDGQKGKVDHRPKKSKDLADSLAGVVFGISRRKLVWQNHGISVVEMDKFRDKLVLKDEIN